MDPIEPNNHTHPPDAAPAQDGADDQDPNRPPFPVVVLAAPGFILTLFAAMHDALVQSVGSVRMAITVGIVAAAGAVACFAVIGAKSQERHVHFGVAIAIGATIFATCAAVLRLT